MKNWIVSVTYGNRGACERFETKEEAEIYAKLLSVKPSWVGLKIGIYKLESFALYEPEIKLWKVDHND